MVAVTAVALAPTAVGRAAASRFHMLRAKMASGRWIGGMFTAISGCCGTRTLHLLYKKLMKHNRIQIKHIIFLADFFADGRRSGIIDTASTTVTALTVGFQISPFNMNHGVSRVQTTRFLLPDFHF